MVTLLLKIVKSKRQTWEHRKELCFKGLVVFKDETAIHLSPFVLGKKLTAMDVGNDRDRNRERLRFPTCQVWAESFPTGLWQKVSLA